MLTTVTYYRISRNDDDRRESIYDRLFDLALRWCPKREYDPNGEGVDDELVDEARTTLHRLMQGDEVSSRHLARAREYLHLAGCFYRRATWEPYPGRNQEAENDVVSLFAELGPLA